MKRDFKRSLKSGKTKGRGIWLHSERAGKDGKDVQNGAKLVAQGQTS